VSFKMTLRGYSYSYYSRLIKDHYSVSLSINQCSLLRPT